MDERKVYSRPFFPELKMMSKSVSMSERGEMKGGVFHCLLSDVSTQIFPLYNFVLFLCRVTMFLSSLLRRLRIYLSQVNLGRKTMEMISSLLLKAYERISPKFHRKVRVSVLCPLHFCASIALHSLLLQET